MDKLTEDTVREIEQVHSSWIEFEVAGEGHRLMTLCADDIELLPADAQPVLRRAAVSARYPHRNTRNHSIEITNRLVRGLSEVASIDAIDATQLTKNLCPHPAELVTRPMLNLPTEGARILLSHPSKTVGGPHAPLRILLPRLQEDILKDIGSRRLRRRRGPLPAVWEQERRAALVRLLRYHVEEECLKPASRSSRMHFDKFAFGSIEIDGSTY